VTSGPELLDVAPRTIDRRLLLVLGIGVLLVALVLGGLAVVDRIRGGASSPVVVADRVVAALDSEDLPALARLVEPAERAALLRLGSTLSSRLADLDLPAAVGGGRPVAPRDVLDGLDLDLTGATPREESRAGDVAVVGMGDLAVRVRTNPAEAHGLLRAWFAYRRTEDPQDVTRPVDELPGLGVRKRLVTVERSGRWYVSVVGTLLGPGIPPGSLADVEAQTPTTSPTPGAAVETTVRALLDGRTRHDVSALAATLDPSGSDTVQLWAAQLAIVGLDKPPARLSALSTAGGPGDANRAVVRVRTLKVGDGTGFDLTGPCLAANGERGCLHPSGYRYAGGLGSLSAFELLGHDESFALTAVHGPDGWVTSLPESLADALIGYGDGLTREQVLMVLDQERLDAPGGELRPDQPQDAAFTSGGYALRTVRIEQAGLYRVVPGQDGANRSALYGPDGQPSLQPFFPNDSVYRLTPGDHTLLVWADDGFTRTLDRAGADPYVQRVEVRSVR
jgi:hypothetical protein